MQKGDKEFWFFAARLVYPQPKSFSLSIAVQYLTRIVPLSELKPIRSSVEPSGVLLDVVQLRYLRRAVSEDVGDLSR